MKTLVAGIGSTILGDDGVGIHVVRLLGERSLPVDVALEEVGTAGVGLLDLARGYERLICVDACISGEPVGTVRTRPADDVAGAVHLGAGHDLDLPGALALGRRLRSAEIPSEVHLVTIEVARITDFTEDLSPEAVEALPHAVREVERLLRTRP